MDAGVRLTLKKPSFWKSTIEIFDTSHAKCGTFVVRNHFTYRAAEGAYGARKLLLGYRGWTANHAEAKDESGRVVGTMHRTGWCGNKGQLILHEKEYMWRQNAWGTRFFIELSDGTKVMEVSGCAGFGREGTARLFQTLPDDEALELLFMGLYQMRLLEMEVAVSTAVVSVLVVSSV